MRVNNFVQFCDFFPLENNFGFDAYKSREKNCRETREPIQTFGLIHNAILGDNPFEYFNR